MADPVNLHVVYRSKGSGTATTCAVTDPADLHDSCAPLLSLFDTATLSPDVDHLVLSSTAFTKSVTIRPGVQQFLILEEATTSPGQYTPKLFTTHGKQTAEAQAKKSLEEQRKPEVTTPGPPAGKVFEAAVGGHGSTGEEIAPFKTSGTRGIVQTGDPGAFTGGGFDASIRLLLPRLKGWKWASWLNVSLQGSGTWGSVNNH